MSWSNNNISEAYIYIVCLLDVDYIASWVEGGAISGYSCVGEIWKFIKLVEFLWDLMIFALFLMYHFFHFFFLYHPCRLKKTRVSVGFYSFIKIFVFQEEKNITKTTTLFQSIFNISWALIHFTKLSSQSQVKFSLIEQRLTS